MPHRNNKTITEIIVAITNEFAEEITAEDVIILFEDILKYFHKNELDLIQLDKLSHDQKTELYTEIKTLITLLRSLSGNSANRSITRTLTNKLIEVLSVKARAKRHHLTKQQLEVKIKEEQKEILTKLGTINLHTTHKNRYKARKLEKSLPKKIK